MVVSLVASLAAVVVSSVASLAVLSVVASASVPSGGMDFVPMQPTIQGWRLFL